MHDLIERQAAIDAVISLCNNCNPGNCGPCLVNFPGMMDCKKVLEELPSAQPEQTNSWCINSWCVDCKEYDTENKCCPRYNRVIKQTLDDAYRHAETEAEARFHAQQRWIPCSERLPLAEYGESHNVLVTCGHRDSEDTSVRWINTLYFNGGCWCYPTGETYDQKVYAWMPLPEPYAERRTDE